MSKSFEKILIFGAGGQVGSNLAEIYRGKKDLTLADFEDANFAKPQEVEIFLKNLTEKPEIIINACAYTAVDKAEEEPEICGNVNHKSAKILANYCAENSIPLIHYSTDYVYNGEGESEFLEDDESALEPLSIYGKTKLLGDRAIEKSGCDYIILRTSWVYNHRSKNFVSTMIKLAMEREELKIIDDQVGSPTYAYDLARVTEKIISKTPYFDSFLSGVYHACPSDKVSWYDFAKMVIDHAKQKGLKVKAKNIFPIPTSAYPTAAKRPLNSRLSVAKLKQNFGIKFPELEESCKLAMDKMDIAALKNADKA